MKLTFQDIQDAVNDDEECSNLMDGKRISVCPLDGDVSIKYMPKKRGVELKIFLPNKGRAVVGELASSHITALLFKDKKQSKKK